MAEIDLVEQIRDMGRTGVAEHGRGWEVAIAARGIGCQVRLKPFSRHRPPWSNRCCHSERLQLIR